MTPVPTIQTIAHFRHSVFAARNNPPISSRTSRSGPTDRERRQLHQLVDTRVPCTPPEALAPDAEEDRANQRNSDCQGQHHHIWRGEALLCGPVLI